MIKGYLVLLFVFKCGQQPHFFYISEETVKFGNGLSQSNLLKTRSFNMAGYFFDFSPKIQAS